MKTILSNRNNQLAFERAQQYGSEFRILIRNREGQTEYSGAVAEAKTLKPSRKRRGWDFCVKVRPKTEQEIAEAQSRSRLSKLTSLL